MTTLEKIKTIDGYLENDYLSTDIKSILKEYREILVKNEENIDKVTITIEEEQMYCCMGPDGISFNVEIIVYEDRWTKQELIEKLIKELRNQNSIEIKDYEECVICYEHESDEYTLLKVKDLVKVLNFQFENPHNIMGSNLIKYDFSIPHYEENDYDFDEKEWMVK